MRPTSSIWTPETKQQFEDLWNAGTPPRRIREIMGLTPGQLAGRRTVWNLHTPRKRAKRWNPNTAAIREGRTRYPGMVTSEGTALKTAQYQNKIGGRVLKGAWKGMPIYALTLQERATCPTSCAMWTACYGNGMRWAKRMRHGPDMEQKLWAELWAMQIKHRDGFVVRLHILGDFYSPEYVAFWLRALLAFPALHVFGYTAHPHDSEIGRAICHIRAAAWGRFAIRTSGAGEFLNTVVIPDEASAPAGAIICPAQTGKTKSCASCSLCWAAPNKTIAFLQH